MEVSRQLKHGLCDVTLKGKFTFGDHQRFRDILDQLSDGEVKQVTLHMDGVEFVDSAALGMLLLALDESKKHQKQLTIRGVTGQVKKIFDMAKLNELFSIT